VALIYDTRNPLILFTGFFVPKILIFGTRCREPFIGVIDPFRRTVYVNDELNVAGAATLLDALIAGERGD
jgi:hypothetical protein